MENHSGSMRLCFNYHRPQRQSFMAETITLEKFYSSSLGQYALRWEQNQYDKLVSDCFGYNAVQLGATGIDFLKNNRIGLKVAAEPTLRPLTQHLETDDRVPLQMLFEAMPFESESIDLVVMPHSLEVSEDPHALLREIYRILIPGGRIILTGFNLMSLWGLRFKMQRFGAKTFCPAGSLCQFSRFGTGCTYSHSMSTEALSDATASRFLLLRAKKTHGLRRPVIAGGRNAGQFLRSVRRRK